MNAIVVTALKRPYTFVVLAILILLFGVMSVFKTPTDIFPPIKIPVVAVIWSYTGLMPSDMSGRVVYYYERALTTTVSNIEHIESQSLYGSASSRSSSSPHRCRGRAGPGHRDLPDRDQAASSRDHPAAGPGVRRLLGCRARFADRRRQHDAVRHLQRGLQPDPPGACLRAWRGRPRALWWHPGGTSRSIWTRPSCWNMAYPRPMWAALWRLRTSSLPAGDQKIGAIDYMVATNATPVAIDTFNNLPIKQVGNAVVYLRDVAYVHRGGPPQQKHGAGEGAAIHPPGSPEDRRCLHPGRGQRRAGQASRTAEDAAGRA